MSASAGCVVGSASDTRAKKGTHDRLDRVHRQPAFARVLVAVLVDSRLMQDGDADLAVAVDCAETAQISVSISFSSFVDQEERESAALFGCHISVMKRSLGGRSGKSGGKVICARRKPPSYSVSGGLREADTTLSAVYGVTQTA